MQPGLARTINLDDDRAADPRLVGSKAATLARLRAAGFATPPGVVIPTVAVEAWLDDLTEFLAADLVAQAVKVCGTGPLAVRSSSIMEDLEGSSYAGMYDTLLDVPGDADALLDAVRHVASSHRAARAHHYRGTDPPSPPAVLIQPMVPARAAGVAFTADPVTGDRDVVRVSAVAGTGETMVTGRADPDEWEVRREAACRLPSGGAPVIDGDVAARVAAHARKIADRLGAPQDIEWALADDEVVVLQARPITALPTPPLQTLPGGGWQKDTAHYPEPLTPFGASLTGLLLDEPMRHMTATYGLLIDRLEMRTIAGEVYVRPVPVLGPVEPKGPTLPGWLLALLCRVVPTLRRRVEAARRVADADLFDAYPCRWHDTWRPQLRARIDALLDVDVTSLDDRELDAYLDDLLELASDGARIHFLLFVPYLVAVKELCDLTEQHLGWDVSRTLRLLTGRSPASVTAQRELDGFRDELSVDGPVRAALSATPSDPVGALRDLRPELAERLDGWMRRHGWRTLNYDAGSPAVAERPSLITQLLLNESLGRHVDGEEELDDESRARLDPTVRDRFDAALRTARQRYGLREDNVILTDNIPSGLLRRWLVTVGHRLTKLGSLSRTADAAYLTIDELRQALNGSATTDFTTIAARRRNEESWVRVHPGPLHVGEQGKPPDVSRLPEAARRTNGALLWAMQQEYPNATSGVTAGGLRGSPGSPGTYAGPVRVVRSADELERLRAGEVLVCPVTTPAWTVAFGLVGAVVTDGGGALSHAAIVAREHGIPAVLGTSTATAQLRDGQIVTVDGTHGTVAVRQETR